MRLCMSNVFIHVKRGLCVYVCACALCECTCILPLCVSVCVCECENKKERESERESEREREREREREGGGTQTWVQAHPITLLPASEQHRLERRPLPPKRPPDSHISARRQTL